MCIRKVSNKKFCSLNKYIDISPFSTGPSSKKARRALCNAGHSAGSRMASIRACHWHVCQQYRRCFGNIQPSAKLLPHRITLKKTGFLTSSYYTAEKFVTCMLKTGFFYSQNETTIFPTIIPTFLRLRCFTSARQLCRFRQTSSMAG